MRVIFSRSARPARMAAPPPMTAWREAKAPRLRVAEHDRDRVEGRAQLRGHDLRHRGLEPLPL